MNFDMTIRTRVGLAMAVLGLLLVLIGGLGLLGMSQSNDAFHETYANRMAAMLSANRAETLVARERLNFDRSVMAIGTPDAETAISRGLNFRTQGDAAWREYRALPYLPGERELADVADAKRQAHQTMLDQGYAAVKANDADNAQRIARELAGAFNAMAAANAALSDFQSHAAAAGYARATSTYRTVRASAIAAIVLGLLIAVYSWLSLRRAINAPLDQALRQFDAIAGGDLSGRIDVRRRDEMGQLLSGLSRMQSSLINTVRAVRQGSEAIASATGQIAAGNVDLASRTEEQASALQQTAASMDELTSTVKQNADNARQASALASNASDTANRGNEVVRRVVDTMGSINDSSSKIADIISIIEGIAFQTNILALNAAVEAARAGAQGRGFAVVATEVRTLAQRSSTAAKEIKELIDTSVERVRAGTVLVDEAGRTMDEIIGAVRRVTDIMGEIAAASHEQSSGIEQVANAVTQMDDATQRNAALVEEAAAAAQSLGHQAEALREAVSVFRLEANSTSPAARGTRPVAPALAAA